MADILEELLLVYGSEERALEHYGVLGMRWGIRKPGTRGGTPPSNRSKGSSKKSSTDSSKGEVSTKPAKKPKEPKKSRKPKKSSVTKMSDVELRAKIDRIRLEQQYTQLMAAPPKKKSRGRQTVEDILWNTTKNVGQAYLQHLTVQQVQKFDPTFKPSNKKKDK